MISAAEVEREIIAMPKPGLIVVCISLMPAMLLGCHGSPVVQSTMLAQIRLCQDDAKCSVSLAGTTGFDWDRLYVFDYDSSATDREKILGVPDEGFTEFQGQLVFMKSGKIVHQERQPEDIEHRVKDEICFDIPQEARYASYFHDERFAVTKVDGQDGIYYVLKPIP